MQIAYCLFSRNVIYYYQKARDDHGTSDPQRAIWYVDLSPVVGEEIGGYRKCRVECKRGNLVRVTPGVMTSLGFIYDTWHTRTVDISRLKEKMKK